MRIIFPALAALALAACQSEPESAAVNQQEQVVGLDRSHVGMAMPDIMVIGPNGEETALADIAGGEPMLVNLWASWCAPCVKELPTLLALSQRGDVKVLALSQDMAAQAPHSSVEAFLKHNKVAGLGAWQDPEMAMTFALDVQIMPTTILYDGSGKEVWRYIGENDWAGDDAASLIADAG